MTDDVHDTRFATGNAHELVGYGLPIVWIALLLALGGSLPPVARFVGATAGLLLSIKVGAWILIRGRSGPIGLSWPRTLFFFTTWPGVRPDLLAGSEGHAEPDGRSFIEGYIFVLVGLVLILGALLAHPVVGLPDSYSPWLLLFGVLSVVHFGVSRLLPFGLRWLLDWSVPPLFNAPLWSQGIGDFWSDRWNRPFVNMNRLFFTGPLSGRIGIGGAAVVAFLASGILHELALSYPADGGGLGEYPAGAGWGGPLAYFLIQGVLYSVEQRWFDEGGHRYLRRLWTYAAVLGPLPLLFHGPFRSTFVVPLVEGGRELLLSYPLPEYVAAALWVGAAGHCVVLIASSQVPSQLDWENDLESLQPLNRKLLWTYGGTIVLTIISFAVLTAVFHEQLVDRGNPLAIGVCGMIAVFWTARILVDFFYFEHDDWPDGLFFVAGHTMLTSLFVLLVVIYAGTIAYHLL